MKKTVIKTGIGCKTSLPVAHLRRTNLDAVKTELTRSFETDTSFTSDDGSEITMNSEPFSHCSLSNLIEDHHNFLQSLKDELLNLEFFEKSNDLYKFHQSGDLNNVNTPYIASLRTLLYGEVRAWIQDVCGVELNETVDMSCARYDYTDILLCHDDQLEGRVIAYIYYLVPPWDIKDGGALQLFNCDENGDPSTVAKSIYPKWNNFVFFKVSPKSFHQVAEILTEDKTRISISGWFYGGPIEYPNRPLASLTSTLFAIPEMTIDEENIRQWINPKYCKYQVMKDIQRQKFKKDSEVLLLDFLKEKKFKALSKAMQDLEWTHQGPANKRNFETATKLPPIVQEFVNILRSDMMLFILSTVTGLNLSQIASDDDDSDSTDNSNSSSDNDEPKCKTLKTDELKDDSDQQGGADAKCDIEIRRFKHGSYTLLHDMDQGNLEYALDCLLFFNCQDWQSEYGGYVSYIANDADEELLTVYPEANALALIYRDKETLRFVKHVNHRSVVAASTSASQTPLEFQTIWSTYNK